eukprot:NODE_15_length_2991_cov_108.846718_g14_i0.p1 GENE.NODE_15_length_2991_cov_108.846718_g14_i0~~NODE_15_length_2991_cov_108.846718_g14_i0.p1  ORF type:complete len:957 (+),score=281.10 NODE_15_length_2991_cov_108.846718_g14_i0:391-2871(+)
MLEKEMAKMDTETKQHLQDIETAYMAKIAEKEEECSKKLAEAEQHEQQFLLARRASVDESSPESARALKSKVRQQEEELANLRGQLELLKQANQSTSVIAEETEKVNTQNIKLEQEVADLKAELHETEQKLISTHEDVATREEEINELRRQLLASTSPTQSPEDFTGWTSSVESTVQMSELVKEKAKLVQTVEQLKQKNLDLVYEHKQASDKLQRELTEYRAKEGMLLQQKETHIATLKSEKESLLSRNQLLQGDVDAYQKRLQHDSAVGWERPGSASPLSPTSTSPRSVGGSMSPSSITHPSNNSVNGGLTTSVLKFDQQSVGSGTVGGTVMDVDELLLRLSEAEEMNAKLKDDFKRRDQSGLLERHRLIEELQACKTLLNSQDPRHVPVDVSTSPVDISPAARHHSSEMKALQEKLRTNDWELHELRSMSQAKQEEIERLRKVMQDKEVQMDQLRTSLREKTWKTEDPLSQQEQRRHELELLQFHQTEWDDKRKLEAESLMERNRLISRNNDLTDQLRIMAESFDKERQHYQDQITRLAAENNYDRDSLMLPTTTVIKASPNSTPSSPVRGSSPTHSNSTGLSVQPVVLKAAVKKMPTDLRISPKRRDFIGPLPPPPSPSSRTPPSASPTHRSPSPSSRYSVSPHRRSSSSLIIEEHSIPVTTSNNSTPTSTINTGSTKIYIHPHTSNVMPTTTITSPTGVTSTLTSPSTPTTSSNSTNIGMGVPVGTTSTLLSPVGTIPANTGGIITKTVRSTSPLSPTVLVSTTSVETPDKVHTTQPQNNSLLLPKKPEETYVTYGGIARPPSPTAPSVSYIAQMAVSELHL